MVNEAREVAARPSRASTMSDMFRAKCRITEVAQTTAVTARPDGSTPVETVRVTLQPVYGTGQDDANTQWSKWTPNGQLQLTITNERIFPMLKVGRLFFVDFIAAE